MSILLLTTLITLANILLVVATFYYAYQTRKMVRQYDKIRKEDLKPLFIPFKKGYSKVGENEIFFVLINVGGLALFVNFEFKLLSNGTKTIFEWRVPHNEHVSLGPFVKSQLKFIEEGDPATRINIIFYDKETTKYVQNLDFDIEDMSYRYGDDSLPIVDRNQKIFYDSEIR